MLKGEVRAMNTIPVSIEPLTATELVPAYDRNRYPYDRYPSDILETTRLLDDRHRPIRFWHYTSASGFLGIVQDRQLRLGNVRFMNDTQELAHGQLLARAVLKQLREASDAPSHGALATMRDWVDNLRGFDRGVYAFCLSTARDDLSQWRAYCPDGVGYCLGFEPRRLAALTTSQGCKLVKCDYDDSSKSGRVRELFEGWLPRVAESPPNRSNELEREFRREFVSLAAELKHVAFQAEGEWRLVCYPVEDSDRRLKFWPGRRIPTPYLEIGIDPREFEWGDLNRIDWMVQPIHEVLVGPSPRETQSADTARLVMKRAGLLSPYCEMSSTRIPYGGPAWFE